MADEGVQPARLRTPRWAGRSFVGETLLLHAEQGLGDVIQFIRYAPMVRALGGRVVFECPTPLVALLRGVAGVDRLVPKGEPLPPFDCHVPLLSLPGILGTTLADVPADVPYLAVPAGVAPPPLEPAAGRRRVGIVWQGNPRHRNDRNRSCPARLFAALARRDDVTLYSLQVGATAAGGEAPFRDLGARLTDFADTAAVVAQLDLVVSVDTALVHLAGALGARSGRCCPSRPTGAGCRRATTARGTRRCACSARRGRVLGGRVRPARPRADGVRGRGLSSIEGAVGANRLARLVRCRAVIARERQVCCRIVGAGRVAGSPTR